MNFNKSDNISGVIKVVLMADTNLAGTPMCTSSHRISNVVCLSLHVSNDQ